MTLLIFLLFFFAGCNQPPPPPPQNFTNQDVNLTCPDYLDMTDEEQEREWDYFKERGQRNILHFLNECIDDYNAVNKESNRSSSSRSRRSRSSRSRSSNSSSDVTPTTDPPTTDPPTTDPPTADPPTADPPTADPPTADPPTTTIPSPTRYRANCPSSQLKTALRNLTYQKDGNTVNFTENTARFNSSIWASYGIGSLYTSSADRNYLHHIKKFLRNRSDCIDNGNYLNSPNWSVIIVKSLCCIDTSTEPPDEDISVH